MSSRAVLRCGALTDLPPKVPSLRGSVELLPATASPSVRELVDRGVGASRRALHRLRQWYTIKNIESKAITDATETTMRMISLDLRASSEFREVVSWGAGDGEIVSRAPDVMGTASD